ncbi:unnamed protein product [Angiostrongylus costaricensis]|uniref:Transposase n=1 Tax=Angiostrongylus costaricensis TaxID=334426 RepID=A0A0R3PC42_ANGCS|nr:unnamed protein product [Angiostrongylus costaricensis]
MNLGWWRIMKWIMMQAIRKQRGSIPYLTLFSNPRENALAVILPRLQGKSARQAFCDIHKEDEILKQQPKQHTKCSIVGDGSEETNRMQEVLDSTL